MRKEGRKRKGKEEVKIGHWGRKKIEVIYGNVIHVYFVPGTKPGARNTKMNNNLRSHNPWGRRTLTELTIME